MPVTPNRPLRKSRCGEPPCHCPSRHSHLIGHGQLRESLLAELNHLLISLISFLPASLSPGFNQRECLVSVLVRLFSPTPLFAFAMPALASSWSCWTSRSIASARLLTRWYRSVICAADGAPCFPPSAYRPLRSRLMISTSSCPFSQAAKLLADRSGNKSITWFCSRSISKVP